MNKVIDLLNSSLFGAILGFVGALFITYWNEKNKTKQKRLLLCDVLLRELQKFNLKYLSEEDLNKELERIITDNFNGRMSMFTPLKSHTAWALLNSDVLDPKKDNSLIYHLHEFVSWCENYNALSNLANLAHILPNSYNSNARQFWIEGVIATKNNATPTIESLILELQNAKTSK